MLFRIRIQCLMEFERWGRDNLLLYDSAPLEPPMHLCRECAYFRMQHVSSIVVFWVMRVR